MFGNRIKSGAFFLLLFLSLAGFAQSSQEQYGKNRIQYKNFNWFYIATLNFDVYYYEGGKELALNAAKHAEADFERITELIGFSPYTKIKLIIYNSTSDIHQSNIGLEEDGALVGGNTHFIKSKIEIPFQGSQPEFNQEISNGISSIILNLLMYGGSLKEVVQSSYLLALPQWFLQGADSYIAQGWNSEMDNYIRDVALRRKFKNPSSLEGEEARLIGQSIWNFIAQKYGKENLASILNLTRIIRNEEESIESTLGITYHEFLQQWREYYKVMAEQLVEEYESPKEEFQIKKNRSRGAVFNNVAINPEGTHIAYSKYRNGIYKVVAYDIKKGKSKTLLRDGNKLVDQKDFQFQPLISWQKEMGLSVIAIRKNKIVYNNYLVAGKSIGQKINEILFSNREKRVLGQFDQILSFDISDDGRQLILSGDTKGQSDLYLYDLKRNTATQLTNDIYDDLHPIFISGNRFAFSSNRFSDSIRGLIPSSENKFDKYQIYISDRSAPKGQFLKITEEGNNYRPEIYEDGTLLFLSDRKGINNLYKYSFENEKTSQLTAYLKNIEMYSVNSKSGSLAFSMLDRGKNHIYYLPGFDFSQDRNSKPTARTLNVGKVAFKSQMNFSSKDSVIKNQPEVDLNEFLFESDVKIIQDSAVKETIPADSTKSLPTLSLNVKKNLFKYVGPYSYKNLFGINKVTSTLLIDPLMGAGIYMDVAMGDMLGNHKMSGGIFQVLDLKSNKIFGEYQLLKYRVDLKLRFDRDRFYYIYQTANTFYINTYTLNKFALTGSYPLSVSSRLSLGSAAIVTRGSDSNIQNPASLARPDEVDFYSNFRGEYVFDNTSTTGMNMLEGTRCKIGLEQNASMITEGRSFGRFSIDLRHYQPVHKEIVFASRVSFGEFFGKNPKNFLLGGMDNWIFNKTNHAHSSDPLALSANNYNTDLLFLKYVTSVRGFNYNTLYGQKYLLLNAELRVPLVKYFYKGPVTSSFFRNLQFVGFMDGGTAWSGRNPFNRENSINTQVISGGSSPFTATVVNYINPFLYGYGIGARTMFLGYYMKVDLAWGVLNYKVQDPKLYLTFGYDF